MKKDIQLTMIGVLFDRIMVLCQDLVQNKMRGSAS